jgi:hypothetical protein
VGRTTIRSALAGVRYTLDVMWSVHGARGVGRLGGGGGREGKEEIRDLQDEMKKEIKIEGKKIKNERRN